MRFPRRPQLFRIGILFKLIFVFAFIMVITFFTTNNIFDYQRGIVNISREVVKVRFEVMSISQSMVDSLLAMEENQKKFEVLGQENYKRYFGAAFKEYRRSLSSIQWFRYEGSQVWADLAAQFKETFPNQDEMAENALGPPPWVPQEKLNVWLETIFKAKQDNERFIESSMRELHAWSEAAVRAGLTGLGVTLAVALFGSFYLTYSIVRPPARAAPGHQGLHPGRQA